MRAGGAALKEADEEIELRTEKNIEQDEQKLDDETGALGTVRRGAAKVLAHGRLGREAGWRGR
jgi:hypothetical protein